MLLAYLVSAFRNGPAGANVLGGERGRVPHSRPSPPLFGQDPGVPRPRRPALVASISYFSTPFPESTTISTRSPLIDSDVTRPDHAVGSGSPPVRAIRCERC